MARDPITGKRVRDPIAEAAAKKQRTTRDAGGGRGVFGPVKPSAAELECRKKGGRWDPDTKTCILPEVKAPVVAGEAETPERDTQAELFRDPQGNIVGIKEGDRFLMGFEQEEAARFLQRGQEKRGVVPIEAPEAARLREQELERQRLFTEEKPVRRELDPTRIEGEETPVIGPLGAIIAKAFVNRFPRHRFTEDGELVFDEEGFPELLSPEVLRTEALTLIEKQAIEEGLTDSERFGEFVESLSLGGLSNFAAEKPAENVRTMLKNIRVLKTKANAAEMNVKDGTYSQSYGKGLIAGYEGDLQRFESRFKLLIQNSPEFKFDSDGVNFIEDKLFEVKERIFDIKLNIVSGETRDPTELQLLNTLHKQDLGNEDSFEIPQ